MNSNPKLNNIDVNIVTKKIDVNLSAPWNPETDAMAAHVYCASNKDNQFNMALCNLYIKKRKIFLVRPSLHEEQDCAYCPLLYPVEEE